MTKLLDALRKKFKTPEAAIAALGLDAALIAMDAVVHDPKTGQFTAGAGSNPQTKSEHRQQSAWHKGQAEQHFNQMHEHNAKGAIGPAREARAKWVEHKKLAEHHGIKGREEMVPTGTGRSIPKGKVGNVTRALLGWKKGEDGKTGMERKAQEGKAGDAETAHDPENGRFTSNPAGKTAGGIQPGHTVSPKRDKKTSGGWRRDKEIHTVSHVLHGGGMIRTKDPQGKINQFHESQVTRHETPHLAGDSKERSMTTKVKFSPTALVAMGALTHYIEPRLAQDSAIDLKPILRGVTATNFKARRPLITSQIRAAVNGNLAADADIEDLGQVLDRIDQLADEGREALGEAREGEDAPEDLDAEGSGEMEGAGEGGGEDDEDEIKQFLADKLSPEDLETVCAMMRAKGGDEAPEMKPDTEENKEKEPAMDKKAMDAAISAAIQANDRKHTEIAAARAEVRPYVGELTIGCDSAEAVYRHALTALGVDVKGVHRDALPAILKHQPKPGARRQETRLATDAAAAKGFSERFPSASRIGTA